MSVNTTVHRSSRYFSTLKKELNVWCMLDFSPSPELHVQYFKMHPYIGNFAARFGYLYVTIFAKRGLPTTSNFPTSTIHNFRWLMLLSWNVVIRKHQHRWIARESFSLVCISVTKLWSFKFIQLDVCGRPFFENPATYYCVKMFC